MYFTNNTIVCANTHCYCVHVPLQIHAFLFYMHHLVKEVKSLSLPGLINWQHLKLEQEK